MWIVYFILALFVVVLILSLRNGVAYGMGFNQNEVGESRDVLVSDRRLCGDHRMADS